MQNLRDWAVRQKILASDHQGYVDRLRALYPLTFSGNALVIGGMRSGLHVHVPFPPATGQPWFWAKITGHLAISGADNRWQYSYTEQRRTATGFEAVSGGHTGTTDTRFAINSIEANNADTGIQGNSIDHDDEDYPDTFELQPVRGNPVVQMWVGTDADGNACYTFSYVNAEQGPCPEEA